MYSWESIRLFLKQRWPFVAAFLFLLTVAAVGRGVADDQDGRQVTVLPVAIETVRYQDSHMVAHRFTGRITAEKRSNLSFDLGGRLQQVLVDHGDVFKKGDALAELDMTRTEVRRRQLEAQLDEAKATLQLASRTRARAEETFQQNNTSEQRMDEAIANEVRARAQVNSTQAQLDLVRVDIARSTLRAPFDGTVDRRLLDEGEVVVATQPIVSVIDSGGMEAQVGMGREYAQMLELGQRAMLDDEDGHSWPAEVIRISSVIRGDTRTMLVAFGFLEPNHGADGELVSVTIETPRQARGFWAPVSALTADIRGLWRLYALAPVGGGYEVRAENVQILHVEGERAYVSGTVNDGTRFVATGLKRLTPGQRVRPANGLME